MASLRLSLLSLVALAVTAAALASPMPIAAEGDTTDVDDLDLARMMPSPEQLGTEFEGFNVDPGSGYYSDLYTDNGQGYSLLYLNFGLSAPVGLFGAMIDAGLYDSPAAASADLEATIHEVEEHVGDEYAPGVIVDDVTRFSVSGLADEAAGVTVTFDSDGEAFVLTAVFLRVGRLLADVTLLRFDTEDVRGQTAQVAQELAARIKAVLTGEITDVAAPLPPDLNCADGANSIDAALLLQFDAALVSGLPCEFLADANGDGRIDAIDAAIVLQLNAGLVGWPIS